MAKENPGELASRLALAEGLLMALHDEPTRLTVSNASALLEGRRLSLGSGSPRASREEVKEVRSPLAREVDRVKSLLREAAPAVPAAPPKPPKPGKAPTAKGRGGKSKKDPVKSESFEKQHPRAPKGRVGGGTWILKKGDGTDAQGPNARVQQLQQRLGQLGYTTAQDGQYGNYTETAVKSFQKDYGLAPNGKIDAATLALLRNPPPAKYHQANPTSSSSSSTHHRASSSSSGSSSTTGSGSSSTGSSSTSGSSTAHSASSTSTKKGAKNLAASINGLSRGAGMGAQPDPHVKTLQQALVSAGFDVGVEGVDGRFGPHTQAAVEALQRKYGLKVDGIVGKQTTALLERLAKKGNAPATPKPKPTPRFKSKPNPTSRASQGTATKAPGKSPVAGPTSGSTVGTKTMHQAAAVEESAFTDPMRSVRGWRPELHPRDRSGQFRDVLNRLLAMGRGEHDIVHGTKVSKVSPTHYSVGGRTVEGARVAAKVITGTDGPAHPGIDRSPGHVPAIDHAVGGPVQTGVDAATGSKYAKLGGNLLITHKGDHLRAVTFSGDPILPIHNEDVHVAAKHFGASHDKIEGLVSDQDRGVVNSPRPPYTLPNGVSVKHDPQPAAGAYVVQVPGDKGNWRTHTPEGAHRKAQEEDAKLTGDASPGHTTTRADKLRHEAGGRVVTGPFPSDKGHKVIVKDGEHVRHFRFNTNEKDKAQALADQMRGTTDQSPGHVTSPERRGTHAISAMTPERRSQVRATRGNAPLARKPGDSSLPSQSRGKVRADQKLKDDPSLYFNFDPSKHALVDASRLKLSKSADSQPKSVDRAEGLMRKASEGSADRRKPVDVAIAADGSITVKDGNATTATAQRHGLRVPINPVQDDRIGGPHHGVHHSPGHESKRPLSDKERQAILLDLPVKGQTSPRTTPTGMTAADRAREKGRLTDAKAKIASRADHDSVMADHELAKRGVPFPGSGDPKPSGTSAGDLHDHSISDLASIIRRDWKNVNFGAAPYLDAMRSLENVDSNYGADSGRSIVSYFISNAGSWKGETAKAVKAELRKRVKR